MKKSIIKTFAAAAFLALSFTGCQSTRVNMNNYSPVAIITCYSNNAVPWFSDEEISSSYSGTDLKQKIKK